MYCIRHPNVRLDSQTLRWLDCQTVGYTDSKLHNWMSRISFHLWWYCLFSSHTVHPQTHTDSGQLRGAFDIYGLKSQYKIKTEQHHSTIATACQPRKSQLHNKKSTSTKTKCLSSWFQHLEMIISPTKIPRNHCCLLWSAPVERHVIAILSLNAKYLHAESFSLSVPANWTERWSCLMGGICWHVSMTM